MLHSSLLTLKRGLSFILTLVGLHQPLFMLKMPGFKLLSLSIRLHKVPVYYTMHIKYGSHVENLV